MVHARDCNTLPLFFFFPYRHQPSKRAVSLLIKAYPASLLTPDKQGYVPLHTALDGAHPQALSLIKLLVQGNFDSVQARTVDGMLPLHLAMKLGDVELIMHCDDGRGSTRVLAEELSTVSKPAKSDGAGEQNATGGADGDTWLQADAGRASAMLRLSIVSELLSVFPDAMNDVATDTIPVDDSADPKLWKGAWRKRR